MNVAFPPRLAALALLLAQIPVSTPAQHDGHAGHGAAPPAAKTSSEPGNDTFAALAEIVAILSADPTTDWLRADIAGLRQHLVDMDVLIKGAEVTQTDVPGGLKMRISLTGRSGAAASRMIPAHAPVLTAETGWSSQVMVLQDGILWTVSASSEADARKIKALGFWGLMAIGAHHQAHHLALARGAHAH